jgi:uncharacterized RDD family membrane protein YckC
MRISSSQSRPSARPGWLIAILFALTLAGPAAAQQVPEAPDAPQAPARQTPSEEATSAQADTAQPDLILERQRYARPAVRVGQDVVVRAGEAVREVVVISGSATIDGHVERDVVVVLGSARLGPEAVVDGDLVIVSGSLTVASGARVGRDLVVVGGDATIPPDFGPGGDHVVIGPGLVGYDFRPVVPWITRGLLWGRPLVPDLAWTWWLVGVFLFVYLAVSVLLTAPVRAGLAVLAEKPLTAFLTGLLVLLLVGPVSVILSVSIIGIPIVPLLFFGLLVAAVLGKVSVMHWIGDRVVSPEAGNRVHWIRSFLIGFAIITVAYMIPVIGITAWALFGVLGLGTAVLAFIAAWRRESPAPRRPPAPAPVTAPPVPAGPAPSPGVAAAAEYSAYQPPPADVPPPPGAAAQAAAMPFLPPAAASAVGVDLRTFPYAGLVERLAAFALDLILVIIVFRVLGIRGPDDEGRFFLLLIAYHVGFWAWKQTTVGGIICNLRLVRTDGGRLSFVDALVRGLSGILSIVVVGLGMLWVLKDSERQSWHDKIAGTYVVKVPKGWPAG